uniref:Uncharacterized protein n=1 Tax=Rhizophora mucronata TaxID=61149 RepID=A0A2P2Q0U0_RHIMU
MFDFNFVEYYPAWALYTLFLFLITQNNFHCIWILMG